MLGVIHNKNACVRLKLVIYERAIIILIVKFVWCLGCSCILFYEALAAAYNTELVLSAKRISRLGSFLILFVCDELIY